MTEGIAHGSHTERKGSGRRNKTHQFLMGIKKKEEGNWPSHTLYSRNTLGVKAATVLNTQCDYVAFIGIPAAANSKEFHHCETQETLNPNCRFESLGISLCLITGEHTCGSASHIPKCAGILQLNFPLPKCTRNTWNQSQNCIAEHI